MNVDADLAAGIERVLGEHHISPLTPDQICRCGFDSESELVGDMVRDHDAHVASQVIAYLHRTGAEE